MLKKYICGLQILFGKLRCSPVLFSRTMQHLNPNEENEAASISKLQTEDMQLQPGPSIEVDDRNLYIAKEQVDQLFHSPRINL